MIIIQDTREQSPLDFNGIEGVEKVETMGLAYGDYTALVHGKSCPVVFERKSFSDLWGTMTSGYDRYKKEMMRAKEDNIKLILIIEGSYTDVWNGFERSAYDGGSMLKKLATLYVKYDHEYIFTENRRVMARRICDTYSAVERNWSKNKPESIATVGLDDSVGLSLSGSQGVTLNHDKDSTPDDSRGQELSEGFV